MSKGNKKRRKVLGLLPTPEKCKARNRDGKPCGRYPVEGGVVCVSHGGAAPQVRRKAQERIMMAQDDAASLLVNAMADERIPFAERRRAAEYLLNYETRHEMTVTVAPWLENIEGLLVMSADDEPADQVVKGQLVGTTPPRALPSGRDWEDDEPPLPPMTEDAPRFRSGPRLR